MRRLPILALALAAACGETVTVPEAPLDRLYRPTGLAVHEGRLLVASSNADLRFDFQRGGSVIALEPRSGPADVAMRVAGAERIPSFAGELVVADAAACGLAGPSLALVPVRGDDAVFALELGPGGAVSCGSGCEVRLAGPFGDPSAAAVACGGGRARAFVGYLRGVDTAAWVSALDLRELERVRAGAPSGAPLVESAALGAGPVRGMAYDAVWDRLWVTGVATASPTPLRVVELAGGCSLGREPRDGGCPSRDVGAAALPRGLELRGIALSNLASNPAPEAERRVYLTARWYDPELAAAAGGRNDEAGGELVVADLVEAPAGVELRLVRRVPLFGNGAAAVRVLPPRAGQRDVVAVVVSDSGQLLVYDDETGARRWFGADLLGSGAPLVGRTPWGLAVQPLSTETARLFVGSFQEDVVTPIDVPLAAPATAQIAGRVGPEVLP